MLLWNVALTSCCLSYSNYLFTVNFPGPGDGSLCCLSQNFLLLFPLSVALVDWYGMFCFHYFKEVFKFSIPFLNDPLCMFAVCISWSCRFSYGFGFLNSHFYWKTVGLPTPTPWLPRGCRTSQTEGQRLKQSLVSGVVPWGWGWWWCWGVVMRRLCLVQEGRKEWACNPRASWFHEGSLVASVGGWGLGGIWGLREEGLWQQPLTYGVWKAFTLLLPWLTEYDGMILRVGLFMIHLCKTSQASNYTFWVVKALVIGLIAYSY